MMEAFEEKSLFSNLSENEEQIDAFQVDQSKLIIVMIVVAVLDTGLLLFSLRLVTKVFGLIKFTDIPMLLSIVSISLALFFFLIYSILLIIQAFWQNEGK